MLVVACHDCTYGALQGSNDPDGIELKILQKLHVMVFSHNVVIRRADAEDIVKYNKGKK